MDKISKIVFLAGRVLLGLYFIVPGLMKVVNFGGTAEYMAIMAGLMVLAGYPSSQSDRLPANR